MSTEYFQKRFREEEFWREEACFNMSTGDDSSHILHLHHIACVECQHGEKISFPLMTGPFWCFLLCTAENAVWQSPEKGKLKIPSSRLLILPPSESQEGFCHSAGEFIVDGKLEHCACKRYYFALKRNIYIEQMFHLAENQILLLENPSSLFACLEEIFHLVRNNSGCPSGELSILLFRFLTLMVSGRKSFPELTTCDRLLEQVRRYPQDYCSLQSLEKAFHVSREKLRRIFHKHTSMSPMDFVVNARLNNSCWMLTNSTLSIREIAELNGYKNAAFYSASFKKVYGISPGQFRTQGISAEQQKRIKTEEK